MPRLQDLELLYRISKKYKLYCLDEGLVDYYVGEDSITSNPYKLYTACIYMEEKHPEFKKTYPKLAYVLSRRLTQEAYKLRSNRKECKRFLKKALQLSFSFKIICKAILVVLQIKPLFLGRKNKTVC